MAEAARSLPALAPSIPDDLPDEVEALLEAPADAVDELAGAITASQARLIELLPRLARKRSGLAAERARVLALAQAEIGRVEAWRDAQVAHIDAAARRVDLLLTAHHFYEMERNRKARTVKLPYGVTLRCRAQQPEWKRDEARLLAWAEINAPQYVEQRPHLLWSALKKDASPTPDGTAVLPDTGEVLPDVQVIERGDKFEVEVSSDE